MIRPRRASERPSRKDGLRLLVGRLWPRGPSTARATVQPRPGGLAPRNELREWFAHVPAK
ncbi:MAG: DUF488 family protein [Planctomycetes bacterium]|nr:DUF488 family protein [Planctomycetota bacterium]